jgi:uncharacterized protein YbjT (DUF2867 family)
MKLTIFGTTGGTGKLLVEQALAAGHEVVAFVRDPSKLTTKHERLTFVVGLVRRMIPAAYEDIVDTAQVVRASGCDWTIVRVSMLNDNPKTGHLKVSYVDEASGGTTCRDDALSSGVPSHTS